MASERMGDAADGEMACRVCLSPCFRESRGSGISMYVWKEFKNGGALMDARKQIEREIETKTEAFLKEGLGQQPKTDPREKAKAETRGCLNSVPHTGTDIEDEGSDPGSDRNEEGREQCLEDTDLEERGYDVEITDTEASEGLLYEEVATLGFTCQRNEELAEEQKFSCRLATHGQRSIRAGTHGRLGIGIGSERGRRRGAVV